MSLQKENILTFILAGGKGTRLYPLTKDRSKPAVYFAARYRIIDFVLSSCINSNLRKIYILTQTKSLSLDRHIRRSWNFLPYEMMEFVSTVPAQQRVSEEWYSGTADAIFQNVHLLEDHRPSHVFILSGDHIYNMDFNELYQQHIDLDSDLTVSVLKIKKSEASQFGVLTMNDDQQINSFVEKPETTDEIPGKGDDCFINMGIYLFKTDSLVRALAKDAREKSSHDFGKNIIPSMLQDNRVNGFQFRESRFGSYWRDVGTILGYYNANMDFLSQLKNKTMCTRDWPIGTIGMQLPPSFFTGLDQVKLTNSTVDIGSCLSQCEIRNSLIGRNVIVGEGSIIEDSIIMPNCTIGKNCVVRNAIFDKAVTIPDEMEIGVDLEQDKKYFYISDGIVVLPKRYTF